MVKGSPSEALVLIGDGSSFGICGVGKLFELLEFVLDSVLCL